MPETLNVELVLALPFTDTNFNMSHCDKHIYNFFGVRLAISKSFLVLDLLPPKGDFGVERENKTKIRGQTNIFVVFPVIINLISHDPFFI